MTDLERYIKKSLMQAKEIVKRMEDGRKANYWLPCTCLHDGINCPRHRLFKGLNE